MKVLQYVIQDKVGMHARPANKLVQFLSSYSSKVMVRSGGREANAKSIINLMSLELAFGSNVEFVIEGSDEDKVMAELPGFLSKENF